MTDREALAALLHEPDIDGICEDDQVGDHRTCERLAERLIAAGLRLAAPEVPSLDVERLARALHEAHVGCSYAPGSQTGSESHPPKPVCINRGGHRGNAEAIAAEYAKLREEQG